MADASESVSTEGLREVVRRSTDSSRILTLARTASAMLRSNGVWKLSETVVGYARASFIYRWLTREPDPEVIVIDLRETYTVAPLIWLLDRLLEYVDSIEDRIAPYWYASTSNRCFHWALRQLRRTADTRTGHTLRALLEPPEPPNQDGEEPDQN